MGQHIDINYINQPVIIWYFAKGIKSRIKSTTVESVNNAFKNTFTKYADINIADLKNNFVDKSNIDILIKVLTDKSHDKRILSYNGNQIRSMLYYIDDTHILEIFEYDKIDSDPFNMILIIDESLKIIESNFQFRRNTLYTTDDLINRPINDLLKSELNVSNDTITNNILITKTHETIAVDIYVQKSDTNYIIIFRDTTLIKKNIIYSGIFAHIDSPIIIFEKSGSKFETYKCIDFNKQYSDTFKHDSNDKKTIIDMLPESVYYKIYKSHKTIEETRLHTITDIEIGGKFYDISCRLIEDDTLIFIFTDITCNKTMDETINNKVLSFANITNGYRTPLSGIVSMIETLADTNLSNEQHQYLATTLEHVYSLISMTDDTLDFYNLKMGKLKLEYEPFNLRKVIETIFDNYQSRANDKNLNMSLFIDKDVPPFIIGDKYRIKQIISILLSNSIKYTDKGSITIRILKEHFDNNSAKSVRIRDTKQNKTTPTEQSDQTNQVKFVGVSSPDNGAKSRLKDLRSRRRSSFISKSHNLVISVEDTGIGIEDTRQAQIFDPLNSNSTSGAGIGLYIARELVKLMGGSLWYKSRINIGSTFYFKVNVNEYEDYDEIIQKSIDLLKGKYAVIVDNNQVNRIELRNLLTKWELKVDAFATSEEAIQYFERNKKCDIIFVNEDMPDISGLTVANKIREKHNNIPIIGLSTRNEDNNNLEAFNYVLLSPPRRERLLNMCINIFSDKAIEIKRNLSGGDVSINYNIIIHVIENNLVSRDVITGELKKIGYNNVNMYESITVKELQHLMTNDKKICLILVDIKILDKNMLEMIKSHRTKDERNKRSYIIGLSSKKNTDSKYSYYFDAIILKNSLDELRAMLRVINRHINQRNTTLLNQSSALASSVNGSDSSSGENAPSSKPPYIRSRSTD